MVGDGQSQPGDHAFLFFSDDEQRWDSPGALHVTPTETGVRLTGDSDLSTRDEFTAAMRMLEEARPPGGEPLVLELSGLSFIDAHSTGAILRLAASLPPPRRLEVRCGAHQRRMLNVLGARTVRQLTISTERVP